ncbi:transcriptional regulator [Pelagerythrobacter sp.]|uniref:winged helix-turn-helix domain-containing protein n=1 Tax=Pelagerythrobacter sp. TaxID=2800702 RepID=UPI0035ADE267
MDANRFQFGDFTLDAPARRLACHGEPVGLGARYFDALVLLLRHPGELVTKAHFHESIWRGIPVTDEALTQCIRTLRRALGDDAANPRFIETVPKHGYRFVAPVVAEGSGRGETPPREPRETAGPRWAEVLSLGVAATAGGGAAGVVGGIVYGFASVPADGGGAALSALLVLLALNIGVALFAGAAIGFGIALVPHAGATISPWAAAGGAGGGLVAGALAKLLGLDAFRLLLGRTPGDITGAFEGGLLGLAVGAAVVVANRLSSWRRAALVAALAGGAAGIAIALLGGEMMGGSLALLADSFPGSQLRFGRLTALFGETGFGPLTRLNTGLLEGAVFALGTVGAMMLHERWWRQRA